MIGRTLSIREPAIGLLFLVFATAGVILAREIGNIALFWPPNAIVLGLLLRFPTLNRPASFAFCFVANIAANMIFGDPLALSAGLATTNMIEIALALFLLERFANTDLSRVSLKELALLTLISCGIAAGVAATMGATIVSTFVGAPFWSVLVGWWAADALGFALFTPMILTFSMTQLRNIPVREYIPLAVALALSLMVSRYITEIGRGLHFEIYFPVFVLIALRYGQFIVCLAGALVAVLSVLQLKLILSEASGTPGEPSFSWALISQFYICLLIFPARAIATLAEQNRAFSTQISQQNEKLERTNAEMRTLLHVVSHDLKSPLVTIEGFSAMLEQHVGTGNLERAKKATERIKSGVKSMSALISDLLEINLIERESPSMNAVEFGPLVKEVTDLLGSAIAEKSVNVVVLNEDMTLTGDRSQLVRALLNLIQNAVRYGAGEPGMTITVAARRVKDAFEISVADHGPGIDPRYSNKVFDLFFRGDNGNEGTGAGLAIVAKVAKNHGGKAWIDTSYTDGTRIILSLVNA